MADELEKGALIPITAPITCQRSMCEWPATASIELELANVGVDQIIRVDLCQDHLIDLQRAARTSATWWLIREYQRVF